MWTEIDLVQVLGLEKKSSSSHGLTRDSRLRLWEEVFE